METAATTTPTLTRLSARHIGNGVYTVELQVNAGGPPVAIPPPSPVYSLAHREIEWNLANLEAGKMATGSVDVDFSGYDKDQIARILFKMDTAGTKLDKGGVVIKQTDFPPLESYPNAAETLALVLHEFTLTKDGFIFDLNLNFLQNGPGIYKEAKESGLSLSQMVNLDGRHVMELRVVEDDLYTGNVNINFIIPEAFISNPMSMIVTVNPLNQGAEYHKWGRFFLNV